MTHGIRNRKCRGKVVALEQDTSSGKSDEEEVIIVSDDEE